MRTILLVVLICISSLSFAQETIVSIGSGNVNSQCPATPSAESYCQTIYEVAQVGTSGYITKLTYKRNDNLAYTNAMHWIVYLGHTNAQGFYSTNPDQIPLANLVQVFDGTIEVTALEVIVNFDIPFYYNGTDRLVVAVNELTYGKHYAHLKATNYNNGTAYSPSKAFKNYSTPSSVNAANPTTCDQISNLNYQPNIDITFSTCLWPSSITATNPTQTSVEIGWINGLGESAWEIEALPTGATQGTGIVQMATTNPYTFTGLDHSKVYDFYIRSSCGSNEFSKWVGPVSATTDCGANLCFQENFDSYDNNQLPRCWTNIAPNSGTSGNPGARVFVMGGANAVFQSTLPEFQSLNGTLSFTGYSAFSTYNTIEYGTMSDPTNASTFTSLGTVALSTSTQAFDVDFSGYTGSDKYISLKYSSASLFTKVFLDNFTFGANGVCLFNTIFVDKDATGINDGSSWANAYTTLEQALASGGGSDIWIKAGVYKPHISDRNISFTVNASGTKMYGGFNGTEAQLTDRIFGTNETILSGDLMDNDDNNITYTNATRDDNSFTVLNLIGDNIELDGLTISGGHSNGGTGSATESRYGGGIHKNGSTRNLKITNCKLIRNVSKEAGGAISAGFTASGGTGSLVIANCQFSENLSAIGGVLYSANTSNATVTCSISNSLFNKNKVLDTSAAATGYAGSSMWLRSFGSGATIVSNLINCTFVDNIDGGTASGMSNTNRTTLTLTKNTNANHNATISNCIFWNNKAASGVTARPIGGFIESTISSATITNSIDETNFTGITLSGGSANTSGSNPLFVDIVNGDYSLSNGSPAINVGNNASVVGTKDLNGNDRILGGTVDLGPYEFDAALDSDAFTSFDAFEIYPNPATSLLYVNTVEAINTLSIYSLDGKLVVETKENKADVSNLQSGLYIIKVMTNQNEVGTKKFIKR